MCFKQRTCLYALSKERVSFTLTFETALNPSPTTSVLATTRFAATFLTVLYTRNLQDLPEIMRMRTRLQKPYIQPMNELQSFTSIIFTLPQLAVRQPMYLISQLERVHL